MHNNQYRVKFKTGIIPYHIKPTELATNGSQIRKYKTMTSHILNYLYKSCVENCFIYYLYYISINLSK